MYPLGNTRLSRLMSWQSKNPLSPARFPLFPYWD